jgi:hypothetical protein
MQAVTTIGLDIAKSVFQVHGVDAEGKVVVRRQLKRRYVLAFFQKLPPCLVGIEACASSHHWSRALQELGHTVRLMPASYVKPFSNRPVGVKRFQTIDHFGVDVAHGLALLFGIGTKALPAWGSKTRWNNLSVGLAVERTAGTRASSNSFRPSSREGHHSTARWNSSFFLSHLILRGFHAAATSLVHWNSVPSTHMRCMITANRRARATIAFFIPRCLAIFIAQALSQDHLAEWNNMLWAAS